MDKNKKGLGFVVFIMLLVVGGLLIFNELLQKDNDIIQNINNNNNVENQNKGNGEDLVAKDDKIVIDTMSKYSYSLCEENAFMLSKFYDSNNMQVSDLTKVDLIKLALSSIDAPRCVLEDAEFKTVTVEELNKALENLFPSLEKITYNDIVTNIVKTDDSSGIKWDSIGDFYIILNDNTESIMVSSDNCDGCGIGPVPKVHTKNTKALKDGDYLYVYQKMAFSKVSLESPSDEDITKGIEWYMSLYNGLDENEKALQSIKNYKVDEDDINWDLYSTYKWTFKKDNNDYYLDSVELIKESNQN